MEPGPPQGGDMTPSRDPHLRLYCNCLKGWAGEGRQSDLSSVSFLPRVEPERRGGGGEEEEEEEEEEEDICGSCHLDGKSFLGGETAEESRRQPGKGQQPVPPSTDRLETTEATGPEHSSGCRGFDSWRPGPGPDFTRFSKAPARVEKLADVRKTRSTKRLFGGTEVKLLPWSTITSKLLRHPPDLSRILPRTAVS
ncbi:unnamed protein product [Pleuronectes platessa]|uniref:Uncharacterized protein n=1 Tax=Pleuronectes platessa TaxID=8262 RepID=A0A9N7Z4V1_PLEPL|nr:unnamed protein product [Pleuronectes platessa]